MTALATAKKVFPVPAGPIPKVIVEFSIVSIYLNCVTFLTLIAFDPMIDILFDEEMLLIFFDSIFDINFKSSISIISPRSAISSISSRIFMISVVWPLSPDI